MRYRIVRTVSFVQTTYFLWYCIAKWIAENVPVTLLPIHECWVSEQLQTCILGNWNLACNSGLWSISKQSLQHEPRGRWDRGRPWKKTEETWFVNHEMMREKEVIFSVLYILHSNFSRQRTDSNFAPWELKQAKFHYFWIRFYYY